MADVKRLISRDGVQVQIHEATVAERKKKMSRIGGCSMCWCLTLEVAFPVFRARSSTSCSLGKDPPKVYFDLSPHPFPSMNDSNGFSAVWYWILYALETSTRYCLIKKRILVYIDIWLCVSDAWPDSMNPRVAISSNSRIYKCLKRSASGL